MIRARNILLAVSCAAALGLAGCSKTGGGPPPVSTTTTSTAVPSDPVAVTADEPVCNDYGFPSVDVTVAYDSLAEYERVRVDFSVDGALVDTVETTDVPGDETFNVDLSDGFEPGDERVASAEIEYVDDDAVLAPQTYTDEVTVVVPVCTL